jgi:hypothetical protein
MFWEILTLIDDDGRTKREILTLIDDDDWMMWVILIDGG